MGPHAAHRSCCLVRYRSSRCRPGICCELQCQASPGTVPLSYHGVTRLGSLSLHSSCARLGQGCVLLAPSLCLCHQARSRPDHACRGHPLHATGVLGCAGTPTAGQALMDGTLPTPRTSVGTPPLLPLLGSPGRKQPSQAEQVDFARPRCCPLYLRLGPSGFHTHMGPGGDGFLPGLLTLPTLAVLPVAELQHGSLCCQGARGSECPRVACRQPCMDDCAASISQQQGLAWSRPPCSVGCTRLLRSRIMAWLTAAGWCRGSVEVARSPSASRRASLESIREGLPHTKQLLGTCLVLHRSLRATGCWGRGLAPWGSSARCMHACMHAHRPALLGPRRAGDVHGPVIALWSCGRSWADHSIRLPAARRSVHHPLAWDPDSCQTTASAQHCTLLNPNL